jgi:2'-5' RNA ligase
VRIQARIDLSASLRGVIEPHRRRWNPERSVGNPAHVTVIYHDEAPSLVLLRERLAAVAAQLPAFELVVGAPRCFTPPARGVYLEVADPSGSVSGLRGQVLFEPFRARSGFGLHVTILHPDQGHRMGVAWPELAHLAPFGSMRVAEVALVGASNEVIERFSLAAA